MPTAHMPRNSPPCRIGNADRDHRGGRDAAGELGADGELAGLAHQPEDLAVGEAHADGGRRAGAARRARGIGDEGGRIFVGELLQHLPEIGLATVDVGRAWRPGWRSAGRCPPRTSPPAGGASLRSARGGARPPARRRRPPPRRGAARSARCSRTAYQPASASTGRSATVTTATSLVRSDQPASIALLRS